MNRTQVERELERVERMHVVRRGVFDSGMVMDETGISELEFREHPGGWAEFGYDDTADCDERER